VVEVIDIAAALPRIASRVKETLRRNWREGARKSDGVRFAYTRPSPSHYPFQWYWDFGFSATASSLAVASSLAYRAIAITIPIVLGGLAAISLMRGIQNQKAQTGIPISEPLRPSTVRGNVASPSLTGRTRHALNEPVADAASTQWTDPDEKRPDRRARDADAME
jgi:hypothetical protein